MANPLAYRMRPKSTKEMIGQSHLIGKDKVISKLIENDKVVSMVFYGRPGIGKTTLVEAICADLELRHRKLNAVINNKKDIDTVIEEAKFYGHMVLVMDEIHRLNKDKQDILLPHIESGLLTLIGMTTVNAYHSVNPAIRSRCQIYELLPLSFEETLEVVTNAISSEYPNHTYQEEVPQIIAKFASGDARYALNLVEVVFDTATEIDLEHLKNVIPKINLIIDKNEDEHYDLLSALQKSIRGSDVNAALHYSARLIVQGDFESLFRRLQVIAYEDISLANPSLPPRVHTAIETAREIGMPEMRIMIANIIIELALSPKSNSAYSALDQAIKDVENGLNFKVPVQIKAQPIGYLYPHSYPNGFVKQRYLPEGIELEYYQPKETGKYERGLKQRYDLIKELSKNK